MSSDFPIEIFEISGNEPLPIASGLQAISSVWRKIDACIEIQERHDQPAHIVCASCPKIATQGPPPHPASRFFLSAKSFAR